MSETDGEGSWWSLPGPRSFTSDVLGAATREVAVLRVPDPRPRGLHDALARHFSQGLEARTVAIDAAAIGPGRSIAHALAESCGLDGGEIGAVADLVRVPRMAHTAFVVDSVAAAELGRWTGFLRALTEERRRRDPRGGPYVVLFLPADAAEPERLRLAGATRPVTWLGRVSRLDASARLGAIEPGRGGALFERLAAATVIEVAAWSRDLLETLADRRLEDRLWPFPVLVEMVASRPWPRPNWENGLVDLWDGFPLAHAVAAMAHPDLVEDITRRVWAAQVSVLMPLLDQIRRGVIRNRFRILTRFANPQNPYVKIINERSFLLESPWEMEWYELQQALEGTLSPQEQKFLEACRQIRHRVAHAATVSVEELRDFSRQWEANADLCAAEVNGRERLQAGIA